MCGLSFIFLPLINKGLDEVAPDHMAVACLPCDPLRQSMDVSRHDSIPLVHQGFG